MIRPEIELSLGRMIGQSLLAISLLLLFVSGCGSQRARTPFFESVTLKFKAVAHEGTGDENQWLKICTLLNRYGTIDCDTFPRSNCEQVGSIRVCDFNSIVLRFSPPLSVKQLLKFHEQLLSLKDEGVMLGQVSGNFEATYSSLAAQGSLSIRVKISVTPGASLFLERRFAGVCEKVPTPDNVYLGEISLRPGQEWIYYRTELGAGGQIKRYFRLNVSSRREEELTADEFKSLIGRQ